MGRWRQLHELYVFLATRQLYFNCIVECYILIFWQNKVMMMMMSCLDPVSNLQLFSLKYI